MPVVGFLACNGSGIFCGPKLIPIGGLDTELISYLHQLLSTLYHQIELDCTILMIYISTLYLFWKLRYGTCQLFVYMLFLSHPFKPGHVFWDI